MSPVHFFNGQFIFHERERLPTNQVFYHRSPYHGNRYILSLALNFDVEEDIYQLSLGYPYSFTKLQCYLDLIEERFPSIVRREVIGHSIVMKLGPFHPSLEIRKVIFTLIISLPKVHQ